MNSTDYRDYAIGPDTQRADDVKSAIDRLWRELSGS